MSFKDIKFQNRAVEFLKNSIRNKRLSHSLLFSGPEAVGKTLTAKTVAKALICERALPDDCCDLCSACKRIEAHNHPDVTWIGPEGPGNIIRVNRIKDLRNKIALKPFEGRVKFFIIERAHLLNEESANSMLKTLEEPPKDSFIILITDNLEKVFPTLRSRCQWILFSSARPQALKAVLMDEYNLSEKKAHFLSQFSSGRIGKALRMKEDGALDWKNKVLDEFSKEAVIFREDPFFFDNKREGFLNIIDVIISWYRDMFALKNGGDDSLLINIDRLNDLRKEAGLFSKERLEAIIKEALRTRTYLEQHVNPKLALTNLANIIEK